MNQQEVKNALEYIDTLEDVLKSNMIELSRNSYDDYSDGIKALNEIKLILNRILTYEKST